MNFFNTIKLIAFSVSAITFASSCHKQDQAVDPSKLVVTFNSPTEGQVIKKGETLTIDADLSFNAEMHGYKLTLVNTTTNQELMNVEEHAHSDKLKVNKTWNDTLSSAADINLTLTVAIDHGNNVDKVIMFKSQP
jgi:hypothetical protein